MTIMDSVESKCNVGSAAAAAAMGGEDAKDEEGPTYSMPKQFRIPAQ